ncbi:MAG: BamA/TamA family outer membrane protein [Prevotella sp.]|nr:BamA/TamA family outer membrane protein [Prevotella sp.]
MKQQNRRYIIRLLLWERLWLVPLSFCFLLLSSCSTTKHVPDDDQLFVGLKPIQYPDIVQDDPHAITTQEEIEAALATEPNGAFMGSSYYRTPFPIGLWIWNSTTDSSGKIKKWLNNSFGTPPVLMSKVNPKLRASVGRSVLRNNGYLHGSVSYEEIPQKNPKKAKVAYTVRMDSLFTIDSMSYVKFPNDLKELIDGTRQESYIKKGDPFCVSSLDAERSRLSLLFRNNGYYKYSPSYASYLADTFDLPYKVNLRLQLADSLSDDILRKWFIGKVTIQMQRTAREKMTDSLKSRTLKILFSGKRSPIRPRLVLRNMKLRPGQPYSYDNYVESVQKINGAGVFSTTDFQFTPRPNTDTLDLAVTCTFEKPFDFYVEGNFNNRTIGRMGPEAKIGLTWRNALRGAEKIDVNVHGAYEWQANSSGSEMNSYQYGIDGSIEFPRIIAPFLRDGAKRTKDGRIKIPRRFYSTPSTVLKGSTDIINRPKYYKMHIVSGELFYRWQTSEQSRHEFSPLTVKYQFMNSHTDAFEEAVMQYPYLAVTMSDYFIPKMRYTYTFSSVKGSPHPYRWETTIEEAGNVSSLYFLTIGKKWNDKDKQMFKNPYSQFLRLETDYTKTWPLDNKTQLVAHVNAGVIYSYGNSSTAPFSERFYVGGANSIRAFTARTIGPGNTPSVGGRQMSYLIQNGDIKFVANLEYRRRLVGSLYGALFLDAGNVWSFENDLELGYDQNFKAQNFFKQLATGTGLGLRYDMEFLVIRVDWGFGLHVPYETSKSGYFNIERFKDMHTLHLAIGYPF